jgi:hypothetical protein
MKCLDCPVKYIGQTGRTFNIKYEEHTSIRDIRSNNINSGYSNHVLNTRHTHGTIADTMDIITTRRKRNRLNTLERYHIYKISKDNLHINDKIYRYTQPHIRDITRALRKIAAHTPQVTLYGTPNIHKACIHRTINNTNTQAG